MAKKVTRKVTKKRVKKNVQHGQAHIQSSFNNTIVTLTDAKETLFLGQVQVD
jgi:small subunit ribosomal protein S11